MEKERFLGPTVVGDVGLVEDESVDDVVVQRHPRLKQVELMVESQTVDDPPGGLSPFEGRVEALGVVPSVPDAGGHPAVLAPEVVVADAQPSLDGGRLVDAQLEAADVSRHGHKVVGRHVLTLGGREFETAILHLYIWTRKRIKTQY